MNVYGRTSTGKLVRLARRDGEPVPGFTDDDGRQFVYRKPLGKSAFYLQVQPEFPHDPDPLRHPDGEATLVERLAKELWWCRKLKLDRRNPPHRRIGEIGVSDSAGYGQFLMRNRLRVAIYEATACRTEPFMPVGRSAAVVIEPDGRRWLIGGIFSGLRRIPIANMAATLTKICDWMPVDESIEPGCEVDKGRCLIVAP